jgi:hypothetical protein
VVLVVDTKSYNLNVTASYKRTLQLSFSRSLALLLLYFEMRRLLFFVSIFSVSVVRNERRVMRCGSTGSKKQKKEKARRESEPCDGTPRKGHFQISPGLCYISFCT